MTLVPRICSHCGIALAYVWITVADRILCLDCGNRSAVVTPILTAAGSCLVPCDCAAKAEALNQTPLNAELIGKWEEEEEV
jgi:hypothetical protein